MKNKNLVSIREAAKIGPLSEYALRCLLRTGQLPGFFINKKYYVNYPKLLAEIELGFSRSTKKAERGE